MAIHMLSHLTLGQHGNNRPVQLSDEKKNRHFFAKTESQLKGTQEILTV